MELIHDGEGGQIRLDQGEVEVFLTLAEELHFGHTAERLSLSQPRVSQLLRSLERRIGGRLFERSSRRVSLTPLGSRLLKSARPAYDDLVRALAEVRLVAQGLSIGFLGPLGGTLDAPISRFRERHPACPVHLTQLSWSDLFGPLRRGEVNLQACLWPVEQKDLSVGPVMAEFPRMLAIAKSHPLAARPTLDIEDLGDLKVIGPHPALPPELKRTFWPPERTPAGRPIERARPASTEQEMLNQVAFGAGVFVACTALQRHFAHPGVAFVPFTGMAPARAVLVWHNEDPNSKVLEFAELSASSM